MNFKPLFDRVVIDPESEESISANGIVLPQTSQERPQIGFVVAIGDGETIDSNKTEIKVKIGDKVLFEKFAGTELKLNNKTYIVMRQIDIIGVFNDWEDYCSRRYGKAKVIKRCWNIGKRC